MPAKSINSTVYGYVLNCSVLFINASVFVATKEEVKLNIAKIIKTCQLGMPR